MLLGKLKYGTREHGNYIVHAVRDDGYALCMTLPQGKSEWTFDETKRVGCVRCRERILVMEAK